MPSGLCEIAQPAGQTFVNVRASAGARWRPDDAGWSRITPTTDATGLECTETVMTPTLKIVVTLAAVCISAPALAHGSSHSGMSHGGMSNSGMNNRGMISNGMNNTGTGNTGTSNTGTGNTGMNNSGLSNSGLNKTQLNQTSTKNHTLTKTRDDHASSDRGRFFWLFKHHHNKRVAWRLQRIQQLKLELVAFQKRIAADQAKGDLKALNFDQAQIARIIRELGAYNATVVSAVL
jgi:hypothetical protein